MTDKTPILLAIDALRTLVRALKKRPDIKVDVATFGKKAPKALLKGAEASLGTVLDGELLAFYAAMNGVEIRWHFIEGPGEGRLEIRPLTAGPQFEAEDEHYMGFGTDKEALFLDGTGDGGAWIVRTTGTTEPGEILFAMAAEGENGVQLGSRLSGYLNAAVDAAGIVNWPACTGVIGGLYASSEDSLRKFKAPPVKPAAIRVGVRVHSRSFENQGRGEVVEQLQIEEGVLPSYQSHVGQRFAKIRFDTGVTAWASEKYMKAQKKQDAYEQLRGNIEGDDIEVLLENIACAVGPSGSTTARIGRDNAPRGAGLLGSYTLHLAFERTFDLYDAVLASGLDLDTSINIEARKKDVFLAANFVRTHWCYRREEPLIALIGGLQLLLAEASALANTTPHALLTPAMISRLQAYEKAGSRDIYTEIRSLRNDLETPGRPVPWATHNQNIATKIGLGEGDRLFMGS